MVGEFVAHDSSPRFRGLNHDPRAGLNEPSFVALTPKVAFGGNRTSTGRQNRRFRLRMTRCRRRCCDAINAPTKFGQYFRYLSVLVSAMSQPDRLFHDGSAYEWQMGRWSRRAGATFIEWLNLPTGLRWLDVGCGNGAFTEELIARCTPAAVAAIDPSEGQIAYARTRAGAAVADFRAGDAQAL